MLRKKIFYTLSKYLTFGLKFLQSLYIAKYLGPEGLAVYGFAQLISLYISFLHFGVPLSIHTLLSTSKNEDAVKVNTYISDGFTFLLLAGAVFCIIGSGIVYIVPSLFEKFQFSKYGVLSIVIGVNLIIVQFFSNIYQVYAQYIRIALNELISVVLLFIVVFYFKDNEEFLLYNALVTSALMIFINILFFLFKSPFKISLSLKVEVLRVLIKQGIPMLVAAVGFYLITFSVRSISHYKYTLYEIGLLTFALNISNAVMMGLNAISWTYYSTILSNTCGNIADAYQYVRKINRVFNFVLCVTIFLSMLCLPIMFYFLPAYKVFYEGICILLISQIFISVSFGYNSFLIAQRKQNSVAMISFITLVFAILISMLVCMLNLSFLYQTIVILLSMCFYSIQICYVGAKLGEKSFFKILFIEVFSVKILVPVLLWLVIIISGFEYWWGLLPIAVFFVMSYQDVIHFIHLFNLFKKNN
jgi:O-antigen/teichoic acid export membrane protein